MESYEPIMSLGEDVAKRYRDLQRGDEMAVVALLEQLAGRGPVLELAIGTGRITLPLAARGIRVDGVDISPAMIAQLRAKPGGDEISVTVGNFADVPAASCEQMRAAGFRSTPSSNPYWDMHGRTFEDLGGYRVVLQNAAWAR